MEWSTFGLGLVMGLAVGAALLVIASRRAVRTARDAERRAHRAERLAEVGAMTGGLAHEIRNPLSTIGLNVQLLEESVADAGADQAERERRLRRVGAIRREVDRLRDILEDFLRFAGAVHLEPAAVDLGGLIDELADFFHPQAEQAGVRLRVDRAGRGMVAMVDAPLLKQAILNLLINAVQAMQRPDAPVPRDQRDKELILRIERARGAVLMHIIDTGPGIAPDRLEHIFRPYFTTRSGGSGLGLAVARRIIEAHGGSIDVASQPGKGTDFTITLPLAEEAARAPAAAQED